MAKIKTSGIVCCKLVVILIVSGSTIIIRFFPRVTTDYSNKNTQSFFLADRFIKRIVDGENQS